MARLASSVCWTVGAISHRPVRGSLRDAVASCVVRIGYCFGRTTGSAGVAGSATDSDSRPVRCGNGLGAHIGAHSCRYHYCCFAADDTCSASGRPVWFVVSDLDSAYDL